MASDQDPVALAKEIIDSNRYMTLGTADEAGHPWVSPVFYAARRYAEFYWMSSPEVTHSQNLARRPQLSIVIFDSQVVPGNARPVYMSAVAEMLSGTDVHRGLEVFPGPAERGGRPVTADELQPPAVYRLYRATVSQHSVLCPRSTGLPCTLHGRAFDHRTQVTL
jgi:hypothetical protein